MPLAAVARALTDETQFVTTNDGVPLAYDSLGKTGPVVVLVHGWSGSRHYFELNARVSACLPSGALLLSAEAPSRCTVEHIDLSHQQRIQQHRRCASFAVLAFNIVAGRRTRFLTGPRPVKCVLCFTKHGLIDQRHALPARSRWRRRAAYTRWTCASMAILVGRRGCACSAAHAQQSALLRVAEHAWVRSCTVRVEPLSQNHQPNGCTRAGKASPKLTLQQRSSPVPDGPNAASRSVRTRRILLRRSAPCLSILVLSLKALGVRSGDSRSCHLSLDAAPAAAQGYHVSRLAADLRDFLDALDLQVNFGMCQLTIVDPTPRP